MPQWVLPLGGGGRAPRWREYREGAYHFILRQDRGVEPTTRHIQWQQLRSACVALPSNGPRDLRAWAKKGYDALARAGPMEPSRRTASCQNGVRKVVTALL